MDQSSAARAWAREIAVLAFAAAVYFGGRVIVEGSEVAAHRNAERILRFESRLGIDIEAGVQSYAIDLEGLRWLGDFSYVWLHWPLLLTVLAVLYKRDHRIYRRLRDTLFVSGAIGLALFAFFPVAPPRFLPGYVGTVSDLARRHYLDYPMEWTNRFAAFPSFHVGWTLVACLALASTLRQSWRPVALVPAALVALAVVSTGNHYLVDAMAGTAIALGAHVLVGRRHRTLSSGGSLSGRSRSGGAGRTVRATDVREAADERRERA